MMATRRALRLLARRSRPPERRQPQRYTPSSTLACPDISGSFLVRIGATRHPEPAPHINADPRVNLRAEQGQAVPGRGSRQLRQCVILGRNHDENPDATPLSATRVLSRLLIASGAGNRIVVQPHGRRNGPESDGPRDLFGKLGHRELARKVGLQPKNRLREDFRVGLATRAAVQADPIVRPGAILT